MRRGVTGSLAFVMALAVGGGVSAHFPLQDCPKCHYSFDGDVPPPMVGGVATGSGFVVHPDGYILTNYHVIEGSRSVQVKVGGREYTATVVESLPAQDLALLKVDARGLPVVALGNSDLLQVGDDVFAIGCPGGICGTVTAGRVANVGVTITVESGKKLQGMLMVDITTDPGSSGGPLVNSRGEVVGVTTAGQRGSFGFSIPISQAIPLLRRVPGFDAGQMGRATTELPFRAIRDRMTPVTAFILTDQGTALRLPLRYETVYHWGGVQCATSPFEAKRCLLDEVVPPGYELRGFAEGRADFETWTRGFPGRADGPITFTRTTKVWIIQLDTRYAAQQVAASYCCPELLGDDWPRPPYGSGCEWCHKYDYGNRKLLSSGSVRVGGVVVNRRIAQTSPNPHWRHAELTYSTVVALDAFVIILLAQAQLSCGDRDTGAIWASSTGLEVGWIPLLPTTPRPQTVLTYEEFISWASSREKELLEFILAQF